MCSLGIILLVLFCIVALLLIFLVTVQDENSVGLGGIFGGGSESAFGSGTSSFITKATVTLAIVFMVLSLVVAIVNKTSDSVPEATAAAVSAESSAASGSWVDQAASTAEAETDTVSAQ